MRTSQATTYAPTRSQHTLLMVFAASLLGFGATLLVISSAYSRDLAALQRAPEALWLFVCGRLPSAEPGLTLPLLVGFSVLAIVVGGVLLLINRLSRRS